MERYKLPDYELIIQPDALKIMKSFIQNDRTKHESGGILLGQIKDGKIYVQNVSTPNKFDRSGRYYFHRDKDAAQIIIDYEFANSFGNVIYLGEWHTHPEAVPSPSIQDMKMIKGQYNSGTLNVPFVLMIIQGTSKLFVSSFDGENLLTAKLL